MGALTLVRQGWLSTSRLPRHNPLRNNVSKKRHIMDMRRSSFWTSTCDYNSGDIIFDPAFMFSSSEGWHRKHSAGAGIPGLSFLAMITPVFD
jgi:hypothetical protein